MTADPTRRSVTRDSTGAQEPSAASKAPLTVGGGSDPVMARFEQAARHLGCEHLIPWARFRLGRPQRREKP